MPQDRTAQNEDRTENDRSREARRRYGSGGLIERNGVWYGKWRVGARQVKRKLGPVRRSGTREGLTRAMAEARLRGAMAESSTVPVVAERLTVGETGERLLVHLEAMGRKPSTLRSYRSVMRNQIAPRIGHAPIGRLTREDVELFVAVSIRDGLAPKTVGHVVGLLHSICGFAIRRGWMAGENPCRYVDRPKSRPESTDIRFLETDEVEALLQAVPVSDYGHVYRVLYLAAVMTGARQGELLALRWQDIDWNAQRVRIRRNIVRGEYGTPKSGRGRSVPLADRLGGELDRLYRSTPFQADDDVVFCNPHTGKPMHPHAVLKAYQRHLEAADVRRVRFHDLRHTFGTRMAGAGVPMRTLQEWMGHRDYKTTLIYADYAPSAREVDLINSAFAPHAAPTGFHTGTKRRRSGQNVLPGGTNNASPGTK